MAVQHTNIVNKSLQVIFGFLLIASFFFPWVSWDGTLVSGYSMPAGDFFRTSEIIGGPANPFPQLSFTFAIFWLIPAFALLSVLLVLLKRKSTILSFVAGALSLSLVTVFVLFTNTLLDLGVGKDVISMLKAGAFIQAFAAVGFIATAFPVKNFASKIIWILIGPLLAYGAYKMGEKYINDQTHPAIENVTADFTVNSADLIKEFLSNDTAANKKYLDKTLVVNGNASAVEILADSTSTIKFADSTGSYAIFSLEKNQLEQAKNMKSGNVVSLKGVCSGSIFSDILGTTSISFKRATLNKK